MAVCYDELRWVLLSGGDVASCGVGEELGLRMFLR